MQTSPDPGFQERAFAAPTRILVATDLTDDDYLVPHAVAQAKASNAHVTLVHAILPAVSISVEAGAIPSMDQLPLDRDARALLMGMARQIEVHGITCDSVSKHGYAPDLIREELRTSGATRLIWEPTDVGDLESSSLVPWQVKCSGQWTCRSLLSAPMPRA